MEEVCAGCVHFDGCDATIKRAKLQPYEGWCRRNAPRVEDHEGSTAVRWPVVAQGDWCGEFERREKIKATSPAGFEFDEG